MKIIQILPRLEVGGVERGVLDFAKYFQEDIAVISWGGRLIAELPSCVKHYRINVAKKSILALSKIRAIREIIKKEKADIIHARSRVPAWLSYIACRGTDCVFLTTAHGYYASHYFSRVMGWGKFVICPSSVIAKHMVYDFGVPAEKIRKIPRWVNLDEFKFRNYKERLKKDYLIVAIGRLSPLKGYDYLIRSFARVIRSFPQAKLKIVGEGKEKYKNYLINLANRYALNFNIEFTNYSANIQGILQEAQLLVFPSIEAFAAGCPVVASNYGAPAEIITNGKTGILVDPRDIASLSEAILEILRNPRKAEDIANNARKEAEEKYTLKYCAQETYKVYRQALQKINILIIKLSALGDLILALPSFKAIRENFPQAQITLLTLRKYSALLRECPYFDNIVYAPDDYKKAKSIWKLAGNLRKHYFDYAVDLQNSRISHILGFLSWARKFCGFKRKFGFLLTDSVSYKKSINKGPLESQDMVLGLTGIKIKEKKLEFYPIKTEKNFLARFNLTLNDEIIGINVSASPKWQSKNWPIGSIVKTIRLIHKNFPAYKIILFGDDYAKERAEEIADLAKVKLINLCGRTGLEDLIRLLKKVKVFITPDTATLHLAQSLGVKVIALFGPTDYRRHTVSAPNLFIFNKKLPCSFCYKPKCPFNNKCMVKITPNEVFAKIKEILNNEGLNSYQPS